VENGGRERHGKGEGLSGVVSRTEKINDGLLHIEVYARKVLASRKYKLPVGGERLTGR